MLKKLFYASASILMLAIAYHLGANTAAAQAPGNPLVGLAYGSSAAFAGAANGDVYVWDGTRWNRLPNVFSGSTPAAQPSWGQLKSDYRK
jgi:hypothetical protein